MGLIAAAANTLRALRMLSSKDVQAFLSASQNRWSILPSEPTRAKKQRAALIEHYAGWAYVCANRNAAAVASTPLRLFATTAPGENRPRRASRRLTPVEVKALSSRSSFSRSIRFKTAENVDEILEHPLLDLLRVVNDWTNGFELLELTQVFLDSTGDAYWYVPRGTLGLPENIFQLPSQWVAAVVGQPASGRLVSEYLYGRTRETAQRIPREEIVHFRNPNPKDPIYGMGCIEATLAAVHRAEDMDCLEAALLRNRGVPAGVVRYKKGSLMDSQREDAQRAWDNALAGPSRAGRVRVMDQDWEFQAIGQTLAEMSFPEGRRWTRLEIADAFGVPLALLDTENVNLANAQVAMYQYGRFTILPRCRRIEDKINERLVPMYGEPRLFVAFDSPVPEDTKAIADMDAVDISSGVRTVNEARADRNLPPVPWGDEPRAMGFFGGESSGTKPIEPGSQEETEEEEANGEPAKQPKGLKGLKKLSETTCCSHIKVARRTPILPLTADEKQVMAVLNDVWRKQGIETVRRAVMGDFNFRWVASESWARQIVEGSQLAISHLMLMGMERAQDIAKLKPVPGSRWVRNPEIRRFIQHYTFQFAQKCGSTTVDRLKRTLVGAEREGLAIPEIAEKLQGVFQGFVQEGRAEMIARTESRRAESAGTVRRWTESDVVTRKAWLANPDCCEYCQAMNGRLVALDAPFVPLGGRIGAPGLPDVVNDYDVVDGPPLHPNCRCSLTAELAPEYQAIVDAGGSEDTYQPAKGD